MVLALFLGGIVWAVWPPKRTIEGWKTPVSAGPPHPRDVYADTPYLNARPGVDYVGDAACSRCHAEIAAAYRSHPMGRSLAPVREGAEDERNGGRPGLAFESQGVEYTVERRKGRLFHKATWRRNEGGAIAEIEAEVRYALGSGTRGITFLIERDGALFQSPIAWFAHTKRWDISPGYRELTARPTFERSIQPGCLFCHANQFRPVPGTQNRYETPIFQGHAIGCERCHGPGALHVAQNAPSGETDRTIVNPADLSPLLRDSVCQQCHLQGAFRFTRAGREPLDFRPGLPIHRFWAFYMKTQGNSDKFEAVGHVEQMESSRCFRDSQGRLGCISCHDPHRLPDPSTKAAYYRERCLGCHEQHGCALPAAERQTRGQGEDCVACHMPRSSITNIPHTAATDHSIPRTGAPGQKVERPGGVSGQPPKAPLVDYHWGVMTEDERRESARDLGVALAWAARTLNGGQPAKAAANLARPLLETAVRDRPDDLPARESLGHAYRFLDRPEDTLRAFEEVLRIEPNRELVQWASGNVLAGLQRPEQARAAYKAAIAVNPWRSDYHAAMARACYQAGDWAGAITACQAAIRLNPDLSAVRSLLIQSFLQSHQPEQADAEYRTLLHLYPASREVWQPWYERERQAAQGAANSPSASPP
jgi:Tfp pilus assembly protein PilF